MMRCVDTVFLCAVMFFSSGQMRGEETHQATSSTKPDTKAARKHTYLRIPIRGVIGTDFTGETMKSYLEQAAKLRPTVVILEVDTSGGSVADAEKIVDLIIDSKDLRIVALVRKALSAGAAITLACREVYVTKTATIGAATSYLAGRGGRPVVLPADIAEKFQSAWRAVCRKAAQHGGHPSILAEAMIDRNFALTMRKRDGRVILERNGKGDILKPKGRILTLTAREAISCKLAGQMARDVTVLGRHLGMPGWREVGGAAALRTTGSGQPEQNSPGALYDIMYQKAKSLGLLRDLTAIQRKDALEKWEAWLTSQRFVGRNVNWTVRLVESGERKRYGQNLIEWLERDLARATKNLKALKGYRKEDIEPWKLKVAKLAKALRNAKAYPFEIAATSVRYPQVSIKAFASEDSKDFLSTVDKGTDIPVSGKIADVKLVLPTRSRLSSRVRGPYLQVLLDSCRAGPPKRIKPQTPKVTPVVSLEDKAQRKLKLVDMYRTNGMLTKARKILVSVVREYPDTRAAAEARTIIKAIDAQGKEH